MQFVGYTTSVAILIDGMNVFVPLPGQDLAVPIPNIVRSSIPLTAISCNV